MSQKPAPSLISGCILGPSESPSRTPQATPSMVSVSLSSEWVLFHIQTQAFIHAVPLNSPPQSRINHFPRPISKTFTCLYSLHFHSQAEAMQCKD